MSKTKQNQLIEYGVSSMILPGQKESGDLYLVKETEKHILVGVVDGLGHGSEAANAAKLAVSVLDKFANESIIALTRFCHDRLKSTRGVVMALASINPVDETLTWLSIGNVEGMLLRTDPHLSPSNPIYESIIMRPGVVGFRLPALYASVISITKGDILILSTDGIDDEYIQRLTANARYSYEQLNKSGEQSKEDMLNLAESSQRESAYAALQSKDIDPNLFKGGTPNLTVQQLADYICKRFNKGNDDALVVAAKLL